MKLLKYILLITVTTLMFSACGTPPEKFISKLETDIEGTTATMINDEKFSFNIYSNLDWKIDFPSDEASWLKISQRSGKGDKEIACYFDNNYEENDFETTVTITGYLNDELQETLTYTFKVKGMGRVVPEMATDLPGNVVTLPKVQPEPDPEVGGGGGEGSFTITSNIDWKIVYDCTWLVFGPIDGGPAEVGQTVSYRFARNTTTRPLETDIMIIGSYRGENRDTLTYKFVLPLPADIETDIDGNSLNLSDVQPGSVDIKISTDTNWRIESDASWLTFSSTSGSSGNSVVTCSFDANDSNQSKVADVDFVAIDGGKEIQRLEYNFILPPKFKPALSTSITGESVTLADYPQPGEYEMRITSNLNWVISSDADWLSFGPATGSGNGSIKCSYIKNETGSDLRATVNIKGYYKEVEMASLEYEFILLPVDPFIPELLTPGLPRHMILPLNPQPGDFDFNIVSNLEWEIEHNPLNALWLGFSEDSGSGNATVKCMFSKNEARRDLTTTVYFVGYQSLPGGERRERVRLDYKFTLPTFVGKLDTDLDVVDGVVTLPAAPQPGDFRINITSNLNWTITHGSTWLSFSPASGSSSSNGETITYETICAYNATNLNANPLIANVTFTGTHQMLDEPVVVRYRFELPPATPVLGFDIPESTITLDGTQPGSINLDIDSNLKWEIINGSPEWLTFTPANGTGDGTVECSFTENTAGHNLEAMVSLVGRRPDGTDIVKRVEYTFILPVPQTEP